MIHIRNNYCPSVILDDSYYKYQTWWHRECLLCGRWTEVANDGGASWDGNVPATYTDCVVDAATPGEIRRAGGGTFSTVPTDAALTLIDPNNDANCVIAKILGYSPSVLYLDRGSFAKPLVSASGLTGRVHVYGKLFLLPANSYSVLQSPVSSFQVRFRVSSTVNRPYFCGYPRGDYLSARCPTQDITWVFGSTYRKAAINADIDGDNFQVWSFPYYDGLGYQIAALIWAGGKLTETVAEDTTPYFITANTSAVYGSVHPSWDVVLSWPIFMLGRFNEPVTGYVEHYKDFTGHTYAEGGILDIAQWKQSFGLTPFQYPWVVMSDTQGGGFRRGRFPWPIVHSDTQDWRPLDGFRTKRTAYGRMIIPMAGIEGCDIHEPSRRW